MRIQAPSFLPWLRPPRRTRAFLLGAAILTLSAAVLACSGDDDDDEATQVSGSVATATATRAAPTAATTPRSIGTLVPLNTPTPAPSPTAAGSGALPPLQTVAMIDMAPCGDETHFEKQWVSDRVPVLTYKDVPEGTPILFPFDEGRLLEADAREGSILLFFDVKDVGILSVQAAGSGSLDRGLGDVVKGSVIGHFGSELDEKSTEAFEGYQMFAVVGDAAMVHIGKEVYAGQAVDPNITDCLILP
jgi:hypothetical protein